MRRKSKSLIQERAIKFENYIRKFLRNLGFKDIGGGSSFKFKNIQVDACGGHEQTLLIIECIYSSKKMRKSIRDKIKKLRGDVSIIRNGIKKHPLYKKYRSVEFVIATKNILIRDVDREFAKSDSNIFIWDDNFITYYEDLNKTIPNYARYNLLGEVGIKPLLEEIINVYAIKIWFDNYTIYNFFIYPKDLLKIAHVARREIGREEYYQRILKKQRLTKIVKYLNKGGFFPNNIIIAFEEKEKIKFIPVGLEEEYNNLPQRQDFGILTFPKNFRCCWIIDGQHRLYSFAKTPIKDRPISVTAFEKLPFEKQASFFIDINKEQKPVSPDLLWDLLGQMKPTSKEGIISNIVKDLNQENVLKNKIYIPLRGRKKKGQLKLSGICTSIQKRKLIEEVSETLPGGKKNVLYNKSLTTLRTNVVKAIAIYLESLTTAFKRNENILKGFIFKDGGISVMIIIFERILSAINKSPESKEIDSYIKPLKEYFLQYFNTESELSKLRKRCSSEGGKNDVSEDIIEDINLKLNEDMPKLYSKREIKPLQKEIEKIENELRNLIKVKITEEFGNEYSNKIPSDVLQRSKRKMEEEGEKEIFNFFGIGDCLKIIQKKDNWNKLFKDIFIGKKDKFLEFEEFFGALKRIKSYRDAASHKRLYKRGGLDLLKQYINMVNSCIKIYKEYI